MREPERASRTAENKVGKDRVRGSEQEKERWIEGEITRGREGESGEEKCKIKERRRVIEQRIKLK